MIAFLFYQNCDTDPDLAFHYDADPDPAFQMMQIQSSKTGMYGTVPGISIGE